MELYDFVNCETGDRRISLFRAALPRYDRS